MPVLEYTVNWSGARIGSGATVMHALSETPDVAAAQIFAGAVRAWVDGWDQYVPNQVTFSFGPEVKVYDVGGELTSILTIIPYGNITASGNAPFLNGAGGCVRWNTSAVLGGRRIIGRSFIVPMVADAATQGNMKASTIADFATANATYLAAADPDNMVPCVWSRKNGAAPAITSGTLLARPSSLRTRNDR